MFCVMQFILCLMGFLACLAGVVLIMFVRKDVRLCSVWEVLFLGCSAIVLCLCAVLFVCLGMVEVTV